jgi:hypothetical protein
VTDTPSKFSFTLKLLHTAFPLLAILLLPAFAQAQTLPFDSSLATSTNMESQPVVDLQGLEKVTARISSFSAEVGQTVSFGSLRITVRACYKAPPVEPPESVAFLEIVEPPPGAPNPNASGKLWFSGWMFASSPALSALEHPVYDIWVLRCRAPTG